MLLCSASLTVFRLQHEEDNDAEKKDDEDEADEDAPSPLGRVYRLNRPELGWYILGSLAAIGNGVKDPLVRFF